MLNLQTIQACLPLAVKLGELNRRVLPLDGTPAFNLLTSMNRYGISQELNGGPTVDVTTMLQDRSSTEEHALVMEDLVELVSTSVSQTLNHARNVVMPVIKSISERLEQYVQGRKVQMISPYNVVMLDPPEVFLNPATGDFLAAFSNNAMLALPARHLQALNYAQLRDLAKTGLDGFDSELHTLLNRNENEGYDQIARVLAGTMVFESIDPDYALGLAVITKALYDNPQSDVNLPLAEYNRLMSDLTVQAALRASSAQRAYLQFQRSGALYWAPIPNVSDIRVNGVVYRKLLSEGVSPEMVIANEMMGRRFADSALADNKELLEKVYEREMNLWSLRLQNDIHHIVRDGLVTVVTAFFDADEHLAEGRAEFSRRLKQFNDSTTDRCLDHREQLVSDAVCAVFFPETHAKRFLDILNHIGRHFEEDTDPREIALLATIQYICRWGVSDQLVVSQAR